MTAGDCIRGKGKAGKVNAKKAARLADLYDEQAAELAHINAPRPSEQAADMTTRQLQHETATKRRATLQQMKVQSELARRIEGADDPQEAALAILDFDATRKNSGLNVKILSEAIRGQAHARIVDFIEQFGSKAAGLDVALPKVRAKRKAGLRDLVRELFGEDTGSVEAKASAKGVAEGFEFLRQTFNAVGGNIPKRADWGLPQRHSRRLLNTVEEKDWVEFIVGLTDRERMIDFQTGVPLTNRRIRELASEIYSDIVTDGLRDVKPGFAVGRNIAVRRAQSRFFVFRDADAWLEYQERFGEGDAFQTVNAHINGMARDTALMKILGPNPDASIAFIERAVGAAKGKAALKKTGKAGARAAGRIARGQPALRDLYATVTGEIYEPANFTIANISAANRNIVTSAFLGGAWFSAIADRTLTRITENLNGIPAGRSLFRQLKLMNPANKQDRELAGRLAFVNEIALGSAIGQARYIGEVVGPEWSRKISDTVLRLGLLSPWTNWGSTAFGMEFLGHVTSLVGRRLDEIDDPTRRAFDAYGITKDDWNLIRETPLWKDEPTGATFLRPQDVIGRVSDAGPLFDRHFDAAMKLQSMILTETEFAVPKKTARVTALLSGGKRPGTFTREIMDNVFLFKAFPITLIMTHLRRAAFGAITGPERAKMVAHLVIGTAVLGTFGEQLSQISKGRDPLPLDPTTEEGRKVWQKGLLRGGGLGIFGDFIFSDVNRFGGGITQTLLGPIGGSEIPGLFKLTVGNIQDRGDKGGRDLVRFAKLMTPGRSLWYTTLATERLIFDEIQKQIDPDYARNFRSIERRAMREFNQMFFSSPGSGFPPERGPRLERAFE